MFASLKKNWSQIRSGKPGERFRRYHERRREDDTGAMKRVLLLIAGGLIVLAGLVLMPAPGPGILVVVAGGALLARESILAARAMDRCELMLRRLLRWRPRRKNRRTAGTKGGTTF